MKRDRLNSIPLPAWFSVLTLAASKDLHVETKENNSPLSVDLIEKDESCKLFKFSVHWKEGKPFIPGEYDLVATTSAAGPGAEKIVIPVVVPEDSAQ